jgi:hypothetical protein
MRHHEVEPRPAPRNESPHRPKARTTACSVPPQQHCYAAMFTESQLSDVELSAPSLSSPTIIAAQGLVSAPRVVCAASCGKPIHKSIKAAAKPPLKQLSPFGFWNLSALRHHDESDVERNLPSSLCDLAGEYAASGG